MSDQAQEQVDVPVSDEPVETPAPAAETESPTELTESREQETEATASVPCVVSAEDNQDVTVASVIEALLFANDEPVTLAKLAGIVELTGKQVRLAIEELNQKYLDGGHAFRIEKIAGGYQMLTLASYESWLRKLVRVRGDSKLSPAALETLAIVAYKQPVIRADIEAIRGVASGEILRSLMVKGLVKIVGRAEVVGRPMQYGTTKKFLEIFGLDSLKDLPTIEQLKRPEEPLPQPASDLPIHPLGYAPEPEMPPHPFVDEEGQETTSQ